MPTVALLGGECTGKTSLATVLAQSLDGVVVHEELRAFVEEFQRPPDRHEQPAIFTAQRTAIDRAAEQYPGRWVICDPAATMTAIYSQIYFGDDSLLAAAHNELRAADSVIWCDIDLPWLPDGIQRDGVHMRQAAHEAIRVFLESAPDLSVLRASGTTGERAATAEHFLLP
jgi:nicotinamide riboside kinase